MTDTATPHPGENKHDQAGQAPVEQFDQAEQVDQGQASDPQQRATGRNPWDQPHNDPPPF